MTCGSTNPSPPSPRCSTSPKPPNAPRRGRRSRPSKIVGLPPGPTAVDAPDRRRHPRPARGRGELYGITYAKGASVLKQLVAYVGLERFLAGLARLLPGARDRQCHVQRSADRAGAGVGPRSVELGSAVAEDHRAEYVAPRISRWTPELRARDFVALVSKGVPAEAEVGVAQRLLQAQTALGSYAEPGWAHRHRTGRRR